MKNSILSLATLVLFTAGFTSCKKEATLKDHLIGEWKSVQVKAGDMDATDSNQFDLSLQSTDEFDLDVTAIVPFAGTVVKSYSGDWSADDAKQDITLVYNSTGERKTWDITAWSENSITAELVENNVRYQVKFERKP
jgi:hypothetical protein